MQSVRGFFELLDDVEFAAPRQRLLLNRFTRSGGNPGRAEVESYLDRPVDHLIPFDRNVIQAANTGQPFVLNAGRFSKSARTVRDIVAEIEELSSTSAESNDDADRNRESDSLVHDAESTAQIEEWSQ